MKTKKLSNRIRVFLEYTYKGDGKYYLVEQGSRHYNQSSFTHFEKQHSDCFDIVNTGNDAPRGGQLGEFVEVKFNKLFNDRFGWWFDEQKEKEEKRKKKEAEKAKKESELTEIFKAFVKKHPKKVKEWQKEIEGLSYKKARLYKENRVARSVKNFDFWGKYRIYDEVIN